MWNVATGEHLSALDRALYGDQDAYEWGRRRREAFQQESVCEAFAFHYANCAPYRRYCEIEGVVPSSIRHRKDLELIPLIPTSIFKSLHVSSVDDDAVEKICTSSGTQGSRSRVPRDRTTLERLIGSIRVSNDSLLGLGADACIFILAPPPEEEPGVWLPYILGLIALLRPADYYVSRGRLETDRLIRDLKRLPPGCRPVLTGPPPLLLRFLNHLEARALTLDLGASGGYVVTVGGWKRASDEELDRADLTFRCDKQLGIPPESAMRDFYNMVELNTVLFECEEHRKHVPPWLFVSPRDPRTLNPLPIGSLGLLGFLDSTPTAYPGFVLSDDLGWLEEGCPCGRPGPTLAFARRVDLAEGRGCARTLEERAPEDLQSSGKRQGRESADS